MSLEEAINLNPVELQKIGFGNRSILELKTLKEESKQETLEEAAETELYITINKIIDGGKDLPKGYSVTRGQAVDYAFKIALEVAKWQQERSYYDEEVKFIINKLAKDCYFMQEPNQNIAKWFKQFKKK